MPITRCNAAIRSAAFSAKASHCDTAGPLFSIPLTQRRQWPSCTPRLRHISHRSNTQGSLLREGPKPAVHSLADTDPNLCEPVAENVSSHEHHAALCSGEPEISWLPSPHERSKPAAAMDEDSGQKRDTELSTQPRTLVRHQHAQVKWPAPYGPFNALFLRDSCSCNKCVDPSTTQKTFDTADIPPFIRPRSVDVRTDGSVHISWEPDLPGFENHVSVYDSSFGKDNELLRSRLEATSNEPYELRLWNRDTMSQHQLTVDYDSYMTNSSTLLSCLQHLRQYGLLFIESIPSATEAVTGICERIGPLKSTLYGSTWDVRSVPSAKNVAYTSSHLGFHMDLLYVDNPPGLQVLHCLQASTQGGESLFSDALRAVHKLAISRPDHYSILEKFPVTYRYHNNLEWYQKTRPHIETSISPHDYMIFDPKFRHPWAEIELDRPTITAVNWSPPFQAPFLVNIGSGSHSSQPFYDPNGRQDDVEAFQSYIEATRHLKRRIEADHAIYEKKLEPGTAVMFDNRRIVHARRAFEEQGGERWLRGAYIDTDVFRSRLRVLEEEGPFGAMRRLLRLEHSGKRH